MRREKKIEFQNDREKENRRCDREEGKRRPKGRFCEKRSLELRIGKPKVRVGF